MSKKDHYVYMHVHHCSYLQGKSYKVHCNFSSCLRCGGLMVSAQDSGSGGLGLIPGLGTALCSWEGHFTLMVPLSTQVYKWVPASLLLGVALRWTSIPSRGE